ncbi:MAG: TetR/AcrR family transcriptional regulator [Lachnospiraceae bacterium]|nr:TetR/AcrR family transcriptional regulator [Lachnospiraceae bacterium]
MRIVKDAEERKNEILDVAERLFCAKGFDHTSTNDILNEIGIARGTLYYHFKSKEDILDAMIERLTNQIVAKAAAIALDDSIPVLERLTRTILSLNVDSELGDMIMEQVHRPQNALMHQKLEDRLLGRVNKLITKIAEDGIRQGIMHTDYPAEAVEMIMTYSYKAFDSIVQYSEEEEIRKIEGFVYHSERMLGMERGALQEVMRPLFKKLC